MDDKASLFSSHYLVRNEKTQDNIKAKVYFSNITWLGKYLVDFDLRLDHRVARVARARCFFISGITVRSLAPFTWNKSKKETVCLVVIVVKSSLISEKR